MEAHRELIEQLNREHSHTIRCLVEPEEGTCLTYALGLLPGFHQLVQETEALKCGPQRPFAEWLIGRGLLVEAAYVVGRLALYFRDGLWMHAAKLRDHEWAQSKWGSYAVFEHALAEVPHKYGDDVAVYDMPDQVEAAYLLFEYACLAEEFKREEVHRFAAVSQVPPEFAHRFHKSWT